MVQDGAVDETGFTQITVKGNKWIATFFSLRLCW